MRPSLRRALTGIQLVVLAGGCCARRKQTEELRPARGPSCPDPAAKQYMGKRTAVHETHSPLIKASFIIVVYVFPSAKLVALHGDGLGLLYRLQRTTCATKQRDSPEGGTTVHAECKQS